MSLHKLLSSTLVAVTSWVIFLIPLASIAYSFQADDKAKGSNSTNLDESIPDELKAFGGTWLYVEDITPGRAAEDQGPPMSARFPLRVEKDAVYWVRPRGDEPIFLDGSAREVADRGTTRTYRGEWKDGVLRYDNKSVRDSDGKLNYFMRREFRITPEGLQLRVIYGDPPTGEAVAVYRHPEDIPLPEPAKATIADMDWLTGDWVGQKKTSSVEERWTPTKGGAMLGVSRTVKDEKLRGFEYLRIIERDGGLVYVAQPGGRPPTEFVLTQLEKNRAVFVNPRHDYPQRIVYERSDDGRLTASIGFAKGGKLRGQEFTREDKR